MVLGPGRIRHISHFTTPQDRERLPVEGGGQGKNSKTLALTLLFQRKLFVFYVLFCLFSLILGTPAQAHAGFFSSVLNFFIGDESTEIISMAAVISGTQAASADPVIYPIPRAVDYTATVGVASGELAFTDENALMGAANPIGVMQGGIVTDQIYVYTVKPGDTASGIASSFGITLNTLLWANDIARPSAIKPGDILIILPVSGIQYEVKKGDAIEAIAKRFGGDAGDILAFNGLAPGTTLQSGTTIIIPDGELPPPVVPKTIPASVTTKKYAGPLEISGYYMRPIIGGRNARATKANPHGLHGSNGVDLAISCGTPVAASAAGTVLIAKSTGWNGGYGKYVVIAHPNGTQTLYGHLKEIFVASGNKVPQGMTIALVGSTGNSTGCHVHFEIRGAKNPF